ncbi:MAG: response regulator [Acidobacteriia bacterium]|nr:response regulator [Terriglobia bacterium]
MSNRGKRILAIDNDEEVLIDLDLFLAERGYHTSTAFGSREGIQLLQTRTFDFVLLDDFLPDADCEEMIKQIQAFQPGCPVVIMQPTTPSPIEIGQVHALGALGLVGKRALPEIMSVIQKHMNKATRDAPSCEGKW